MPLGGGGGLTWHTEFYGEKFYGRSHGDGGGGRLHGGVCGKMAT